MERRIKELILDKDFKKLKNEVNEINEMDLAEILADFAADDLAKVIRIMPKDKAARVFAEFEVDVATKLLKYLSDVEIVKLFDEMSADDATDLLEEMPANIVARILKNCHEDTRKDINKLLNYKDESAGSIMTVEYPQFKEDIRIEDAINKLKKNKEQWFLANAGKARLLACAETYRNLAKTFHGLSETPPDEFLMAEERKDYLWKSYIKK